MKQPTFREATDLLCLTAHELVDIFGGSLASMRQARMSPDSRGYRTPPAGWEATLAKLARKKGGELAKLAEDLEAVGE